MKLAFVELELKVGATVGVPPVLKVKEEVCPPDCVNAG